MCLLMANFSTFHRLSNQQQMLVRVCTLALAAGRIKKKVHRRPAEQAASDGLMIKIMTALPNLAVC